MKRRKRTFAGIELEAEITNVSGKLVIVTMTEGLLDPPCTALTLHQARMMAKALNEMCDFLTDNLR